MPNHKNGPVGPNCTMNAAGRHFRHPDDPTVPVCDYDGCSFFDKDDLATIEYPTDITTGPMAADTPATQSSEISEVMALLRQQKADEDLRNQNVLALQKQVNQLIQSGLLAAAATPSPVITTSSPIFSQNTTTYSSPLTAPTPSVTPASQMPSLSSAMPSIIASAATDHLASLGLKSASYGIASGFGGINHNAGMSGQQYQPGNQPVTVSNPLSGLGAALGVRNNV